MAEEISVNTVIDNIYKSSYNPTSWPVALESITKFTQSSSSALLYKDNELERASGMYTYNICKEHLDRYNAYGIDPNFMIMAKHRPVGQAAAVDHIIPDRHKLEQQYGEEFNRLLATLDLYHIGGAILFMDEVRTAAIAVQRKREMGVWSQDQIEKLNTLIPHLQRTMNIQKEFTRLQTHRQALLNGMDRSLMGLILFDLTLEPVYINPVAEKILAYHPALEIHNKKVCAANHNDTIKIHDALLKAVSANDAGNPKNASTAFGLRHNNCQTTLPVSISPVNNVFHVFENNNSLAHAVMCFSDPDRSHPIETSKLAAIYGLTPTEAQVAIAIANGISPDEISRLHHVAISTVRSHLKKIFQKLGINHQTELVKILLTGPFVDYA